MSIRCHTGQICFTGVSHYILILLLTPCGILGVWLVVRRFDCWDWGAGLGLRRRPLTPNQMYLTPTLNDKVTRM